jgi:hypothetical protein
VHRWRRRAGLDPRQPIAADLGLNRERSHKLAGVEFTPKQAVWGQCDAFAADRGLDHDQRGIDRNAFRGIAARIDPAPSFPHASPAFLSFAVRG